MKKPGYCPEWFDIALYDNLINVTRDTLSLALWMRKMNYRAFLDDLENKGERNGGNNITLEEKKQYALEWLITMATTWNASPIKHKDSQNKESYDPLRAEPDIIIEAKLTDIAYLFSESYFQLPHMREFFQKAAVIFDEQIKLGGNTELGMEIADSVIKECVTDPLEYETKISECLNYSDIFIVDTSQSDEVLKIAFERKLKEIRERETADNYWFGKRTKRFSDAEIRRIIEYRVFAYIDLYTYGQITGRKFTDIEMAAMIYPPTENTPLDFDAVDRISRTVKPKAIELLERINPRLLV